MQIYRDYKTRVCGNELIPFKFKIENICYNDTIFVKSQDRNKNMISPANCVKYPSINLWTRTTDIQGGGGGQ